MILNEKDKALFKALSGSQMGRDLKDYLERLTKDMCDIRNWKDFSEENAKAMNNASSAIESEIIDKIKDSKSSKKNINPMI